MDYIKPIETYYNGYRFRSRLEARWAVFFDSMEIQYEYEPEGFELPSGEYYLPDFHLPSLKTYVEVKHSGEDFISFPDEDSVKFDDEFSKYGEFAHEMAMNDFGVWFVFGDPKNALREEKSNYLFFKGFCYPKWDDRNDYICECNGCEKKSSECLHEGEFASGEISLIYKKGFISKNPLYGKTPTVLPLETIIDGLHENDQSFKKNIKKIRDKMVDAANKARKARFEHGESQ